MRLLLDTNVVLLAATDPDRLGALLALLADKDNDLLVSSVVTWEIAIKQSTGKLTLDQAPLAFVSDALRRLEAVALDITHRHAAAVTELPLHHRDPFDRMLLAQATTEHLVLATTDEHLAAYDVDVLRP